jgi:protein SCO1
MRDLPLTHGSFIRVGAIVIMAWIAQCLSSSYGYSQPQVPDELKNVSITEHMGETVSISDLTFQDEQGNTVPLSTYFKSGRPVLLTLVYYQCPHLCNFLLNGLVKSLKTLDWTPGGQFDIVTVSINPKENSDLARHKKENYLKEYGRPEASPGWHFLVGEETQIQKLASQVGFGYEYDPKDKQYGHAAALFILTPEGKISRYLYGIEFKSTDLKLALLEASNGKIGTVVERFLLFCYQYDPLTKKYSVYTMKLMQTGCAMTVLFLGGYLMVYWRRQRKGAYSQ